MLYASVLKPQAFILYPLTSDLYPLTSILCPLYSHPGVNISFFLINNTQMLFGNCPQVSKQNQDPTPPINKKLIEFGPLQKENWIFFLLI